MASTKEELRERVRKVAEKCWSRILRAEVDQLNEGTALTTLKRLDIYQRFRDLAYDKLGGEMFFEDFCDLFDEVYKKVEADKEWEALVHC